MTTYLFSYSFLHVGDDDIVLISDGSWELYGLCKDGTRITTDENCREELSQWKLFRDYRTVEKEQQSLRELTVKKEHRNVKN